MSGGQQNFMNSVMISSSQSETMIIQQEKKQKYNFKNDVTKSKDEAKNTQIEETKDEQFARE